MNANFGSIDTVYQQVDMDYVKAMAEQMGPSEATYNGWQKALNYCEIYVKEGLTPVVVLNRLNSSLSVTSEESIHDKFH